MRRSNSFLFAFCAALVGCGSSENSSAPAIEDSGSIEAGSIDAANDARSNDTRVDDTPAIDGAALTVRCGDGPYLVVTRPTSGTAPARTLLRAPLWFSGTAHDVTVSMVSQRVPSSDGSAPKELRAWDATKLHAPDGFTGTATPQPGATAAEVTFSEAQDALVDDTNACELSIEKRYGIVHVEGSTKEGGAFAVDCSFGGLGGIPTGVLPFACAKGVAGWLGASTSGAGGLQSVTSPVSAALADASIGVYGLDATPVTDIVATDFTVKTMRIDDPLLTCPGAPGDWSPSGGAHVIWRGSSSSDTWSGPVALAAEENASWFWQMTPGSVPAGYINDPSSGDPSTTCPPIDDRFVLRGTSSAGAWEWEGGWFVPFHTTH